MALDGPALGNAVHLSLELVFGDDVGVAGREVDRCAGDSFRDHNGGNAAGNEGRDCHNHALSLLLLFCLKKMNCPFYIYIVP
jgi:hypothetical protein